MSWKDFEEANPELAAFGLERFKSGVAYLATLRKDGSPRVHPVTPIVGDGYLFVFMEPTSPKGYDLRRDGRYAIHSAVSDSSRASGEFSISGRAEFIDTPPLRALASKLASYALADRYILFAMNIETASSTTYNDGEPEHQHWKRQR
jgi:Pyridoxamine 5'-phosphate oxidase